MKIIFTTFFALIFSALTISAQIPPKIVMEIIKAEDARRYDLVLEGLLKWPGIDLRSRAALAAGRIGDDRAIPALSQMAENDASDQARAMAVFAIGEIESAKGVDAIINFLEDPKTSDAVRARAVEAAGKIAAANARDPKAKDLAAAILRTLDREQKKQTTPSTEVIRMGLTAALRARSVGSEETLRKFLAFTDPNIVSDALNTMSRLRARNANRDARDLLATSVHGVVRANAARLLGVAEDKDAFDVLLTAATKDADSRVRVSAIRSLAGLKDAKAADRLIEYGNGLLANAKGITNSPEKSELLELATTVSRLVPNSNNEKAIAFLQSIRVLDRFSSAETEISLATVAPAKYVAEFRSTNNGYGDRHAAEAYAQGIGSIAASKDEALKTKAREALMTFVSGMATSVKPAYQREMVKAMPELQRAVAAFKPDNLDQLMRDALANDDVNVRADAAGMIAGLPYSKENIEALNKAFSRAFIMDKTSDDAMLSIMGALYRLDKKGSVGSFLVALDSPDYLVRKRAFEMLSDKDIQAASPGVVASLENALAKHKDQVLPYSPAFGTKLGQVLNTALDYRRALARKNGTVKAVFTTEKGTFTIDFYPEDAPLTVDNFVKLARTGYFNGLEVHRVVPNFVMQDGDPRGDGNGGPGWSIRCEVNMREYDRGAVGMALSGKDTGGSQWFVTHSPQPHLDGGYTVFGHVNETGMKVVDNIVRGDKIISVRIVGR